MAKGTSAIDPSNYASLGLTHVQCKLASFSMHVQYAMVIAVLKTILPPHAFGAQQMIHPIHWPNSWL